MEILLDINGSDNGVTEAINAVLSIKKRVKAKIIMVGDKEIIKEHIVVNFGYAWEQEYEKLNIIDAKDVITNFDDPALAIKSKQEASIVKAYNYMKEHDDTVFISAGSTGAVMAGGLLKLKRIEGIHRPALATVLPTVNNQGVVLLDCGANVTAAGISLEQFALMGIVYAKEVLKKDNIKVGLLNIGTEDKKGSPDLKEAYDLLKSNVKEFVGNVEAREMLSGEYDVIVANGLMGNVALKALEGTASIMKSALVSEFNKNIFNKMAAATSIGIIKKALSKYDYTKYGGAVLLGVKKPVIKIHGNAKQKNYEIAILQAENILKQNLIDSLVKSIEMENR